MTRTERIAIALLSAILSLPAFIAVYAGTVITYSIAVLSGYDRGPLQAILLLLKSVKGFATLSILALMIVHVAVFIYLLVRFARGRALPKLAQLYCLTLVILAIGEKIRLSLVSGDTFFWFGVWSLPHALCLFWLVWTSEGVVTKQPDPAKVVMS